MSTHVWLATWRELSTYYYGYDGHGSVRMLLSGLSGASTTITDSYDYDAYGQLLAKTGDTVNHYRYAGEQWDADLRMYYNRARYLNPNTGRFWVMDSYEGSPFNPHSLHKYLYAEANPVINTDPSGHESLNAVSVSLSIIGMGFAQMSPKTTASGAVAAGNTCGPDVTAAVVATAKDVDNTWFAAGPGRAAAAFLGAFPPGSAYRYFDVQKLHDLGERDSRVDFGNGSHLGTGQIGLETVQFGSFPGGKLGVYYAGSVNYFLWGKIFSLAHHTLKHPLTGQPDPATDESVAVALARAHKWRLGDRGTDYEKQAVAFVKFAYRGGLYDPSDTALKTIKTDPSNVGSSSRFLWKWKGLHDNLE